MGKYMKKAKITGEIAVMEVSQSSFGVRTRAKTLALQRLKKTTTTTSMATTTTKSGSCYLQLRSRRLEKPPLPEANFNESKKQHQHLHKESYKENPNPRTSSWFEVVSENSGSVGSVSLSCSKNKENLSCKEVTRLVTKDENGENNFDLGIEASFGENVLEVEGRERTTRETTPCSLIRDSDTIGTPGSTTKPTNSTARRIQCTLRRNIPTTHEMEEFFAIAERKQQRLFTEKYNFDPVNELPLTGRYEWLRFDP